jgi:hypothetical protein
MTNTLFRPDFKDKTRCISVHWSLPVQCVLSPTHRENWHETWHPKSGNRLRYRHPGKHTEELRGGEWHAIQVPIGAARIATIRSLYLGLPVVEELLGEIERLNAQVAALEAAEHLRGFDVRIKAPQAGGESTLWLGCARLPYRNFKQQLVYLDDIVRMAMAHAARCPGHEQSAAAGAAPATAGIEA